MIKMRLRAVLTIRCYWCISTCKVLIPATTDVNSSRLLSLWTLIDSGCEWACICTQNSVCSCGSPSLSKNNLHINIPSLAYFINLTRQVFVHRHANTFKGAWARAQQIWLFQWFPFLQTGMSSLLCWKCGELRPLRKRAEEKQKESKRRYGGTLDTIHLSLLFLQPSANERKRWEQPKNVTIRWKTKIWTFS